MAEQTSNNDIEADEYDEAFNEFADKGGEYQENLGTEDNEEEENNSDDIAHEDQAEEPDNSSDELEELKKRNEELEHYRKSNEGRVSALQRKVDELSIKKEDDSTNANKENPVLVDEEWERFKDEDEFIAEHVEKRIDRTKQTLKEDMLSEIDKRLEPIQAREEELYVQNQLQILSEQEPGWEEVVHSEDFSQWIDRQPRAVADMVSSTEADDYMYLIRSYKSINNLDTNNSSNEIRDKRKKKLASNVAIPRRNVTNKAAPPQDFDGAFDYYAEKIAREKARGY